MSQSQSRDLGGLLRRLYSMTPMSTFPKRQHARGHKTSRIIPQSVLQALMVIMWLGNLLYGILPSKWDPRKRRFVVDASIWNGLTRAAHFLGRIGVAILCLGYCIIFRANVWQNVWSSFFIVCAFIFFVFSSTLSVHFALHPEFLPLLFYRVQSINNQFGTFHESHASVYKEIKRTNKRATGLFIILTGLGMVGAPAACHFLWLLDVHVATVLTNLAAAIIHTSVSTAHYIALVIISGSILSEMTIWTAMGPLLLASLTLTRYCLAVAAKQEESGSRTLAMYRQLQLMHQYVNVDVVSTKQWFIICFLTHLIIATFPFCIIRVLNSPHYAKVYSSESLAISGLMFLFTCFVLGTLTATTNIFDSVTKGSVNFVNSVRVDSFWRREYGRRCLRTFRPLEFTLGFPMPYDNQTLVSIIHSFTLDALVSLLMNASGR